MHSTPTAANAQTANPTQAAVCVSSAVSHNNQKRKFKIMNLYFSDIFKIDPDTIEGYGAFNISLINDLPLFIDPFLLFGSPKPEYQELHNSILKYLTFLKEKSEQGITTFAEVKSWYLFPEVKQNWFGYSKVGNNGSGLGSDFGKAFSSSMHIVFDDLGNEKITQSSHLEKASLFEIGVGRDNISDFTTNLIKQYLLEYTQTFAKENIDEKYCKNIKVDKVYFDYELERWMPKEYYLPIFNGDYVILTPRDILTKDDIWINSNDLREDFERICNSIPNDQLRHEIQNYFLKRLPITEKKKKNSQKEISTAIHDTIKKYPEIIKWFVKSKEENKVGAKSLAEENVKEVEQVFINQLSEFVELLHQQTNFYEISPKLSYVETMKRVIFLKEVIEDNDGWKLFYLKGEPLKREADLQVIFRLTWFASDLDINREPNNGRGPVDYAISVGAKNKTLVEFKLASNTKLRQNLAKQVQIYEKANKTENSIKVILFFDDKEYNSVTGILKDLKLDKDENIILIDASEKESASNVK